MTEGERMSCYFAIHGASLEAACIAGGNFLPFADSVPLTGRQIIMINSIGQIFGKTLSESICDMLIKSFGAMFAGRYVSQFLASFIPGIGNIINAATAASLTEYIGWSVAEKFDKERGKTLYVINI